MNLEPLRKFPPYTYLASPYSMYYAGLDAAYEVARKVKATFVRAKVPAFSPILNDHDLALKEGFDPRDCKLWLEDDRPFMETAGALAVVMAPGWDKSVGVCHEIEEFQRMKKPVLLLSWPDLDVVEK